MAQVFAGGVNYHILPAGTAAPAGTAQLVGAELLGYSLKIGEAAANSGSAVAEIGGWGVDVVGSPQDVATSIKQAINSGKLDVFR